ncbi:MAG: hypothetical protein WD100_02745, partial [Tistlia sp.]
MSPEMISLILEATLETLAMVAVAAGIGTLLGLPLGVFLAASRRGELFAAPAPNGMALHVPLRARQADEL